MKREQSGVLYLVAAFTLAALWARGYLTTLIGKATALFTAPPALRRFAAQATSGGGTFTARRPT